MTQPLPTDTKTSYTLAYSTCPNDTYIFHALANHRIHTAGMEFTIDLMDVEQLNQAAKTGTYHISKLSFAAVAHLTDLYGLLHAGAALGRGCGPLIVARPGAKITDMASAPIAVPGWWTTAHLLLALFLETPPKAVPMRFDQIMPAVARGAYDAGVIIHEGRFTFHEHGLIQLADLGEWWEGATGLPIPLGGIAMRRDLGKQTAVQVEAILRQSIDYASKHPDDAMPYIRQHARELSDAVISQHINLYVNEFSLNLGDEGKAAVEKLFAKGGEKNILPEIRQPLFIS